MSILSRHAVLSWVQLPGATFERCSLAHRPCRQNKNNLVLLFILGPRIKYDFCMISLHKQTFIHNVPLVAAASGGKECGLSESVRKRPRELHLRP